MLKKGTVVRIGIECKGWRDTEEIIENKHKLVDTKMYIVLTIAYPDGQAVFLEITIT